MNKIVPSPHARDALRAVAEIDAGESQASKAAKLRTLAEEVVKWPAKRSTTPDEQRQAFGDFLVQGSITHASGAVNCLDPSDEPRIRPDLQRTLLADGAKAFPLLKPEDQIAVAAAVPDSQWDSLGIRLSAAQQVEVALVRRRTGHRMLSEGEHVALRIMTDPDTGTFNAYTKIRLLEYHVGDASLERLVSPILSDYDEALDKLHAMPEFRREGTFYKGVAIQKAYQREGLVLSQRTGRPIEFSSASSCVSNPYDSYAGRIDGSVAYDAELVFSQARATRLDTFQPPPFNHVSELALMPGQHFIVTEKEDVVPPGSGLGIGVPFTRYRLCPARPPEPRATHP